MLAQLRQINELLAAQIALAIGEPPQTSHATVPPNGTADSNAETAVLADATSPTSASGGLQRAKGLSLEEGQPKLPDGRKVAILAADGVAADQVNALLKALKDASIMADIVGSHLGSLGNGVVATKTLANTDMVLYDAVFVPGGADSVKALIQKGDAHVFIDEAYKHSKPISAVGEGVELLTASEIGKLLKSISDNAASTAPGSMDDTSAGVQNLSEVGRMLLANDANASKLAAYGIIIGSNANLQKVIKQFIAAVAHRRFWGRPRLEQVPA